MKDKKVIMLVMFILTIVATISVYTSAVAITKKGQINARVIGINDGIFTTKILLFTGTKALSFRFNKELMYKDLESSSDKYIEISFYQTALGDFIGLDPKLNTYRFTQSRKTTASNKVNIDLICTFLGSLKKDKKLYSEVVKNLSSISDFKRISTKCKSRV